MPSATAHGYPYPLGTDRVMDGDDSIKALADKIEANLLGGVWVGSVALTTVTANTPVSAVVTFPAGRFTTAPAVFTNAQVTGTGAAQFSSIAGPATTSSVQVALTRTAAGTGTAVTVSVLAVGI